MNIDNTNSGPSDLAYGQLQDAPLPAYEDHKRDVLSEVGPSVDGSKKGHPLGPEKEAQSTPMCSEEEADGDTLALLRDFDTVLLIDDSTSMCYNDAQKRYVEDAYSQPCRWTEACEAVASLALRAAKYDKDGIDVLFLNNKKTKHKNKGLTNVADVRILFNSVDLKPATFLGNRLEGILRDYMKDIKRFKIPIFGSKVKPLNLIVITDGVSNDSVLEPIRAIAHQLDEYHLPVTQVGIQFVQIGQDNSAAEQLRKIDDDLQKMGIRDIADTTPYAGQALTTERLIKMLVGGINRQYDRRNADGKRVVI